MSRVFLLLQDAHPDHGGDAAQFLAQAGIHGTGGVQHGVGHVLFALVHHVFDVQAGFGGQGGDLADHARLILVDDADALAAGAGLVHLRQVDRVGNVAVAQVVAQLLRRHDGAVVLGFRGGSAKVRGAHDAGMAENGFGGEVGHVAGHLAAVHGFQQGGGVHQLAAGVVQDLDAVLAQGKGLGVDGVLGGGQVGHMDGDVVAQGQHIVQVYAVVHLTAQVPCGFNGDVGVVAVDLHAQLDGAVCHPGADGTQTDDAKGLALDLVAHKLLFALFHALSHGGVTSQSLTPLGGGCHVAAARNEHPDDQLCHGVGVGTRGVEHHDALLAAALQRDVVHTRTGAGDSQQIIVEGGVQKVGAAHQNTVRGVGIHRDIELVLGQLCQPHRADGVERFDGVHI